MEQPFIDSHLAHPCCGQPARARGCPGGGRERPVPPAVPGQLLCTRPRGGGAPAAAGLPVPGLSHQSASSSSSGHSAAPDFRAAVRLSWGFRKNALCPVPQPGVKVATHPSSPSTQLRWAQSGSWEWPTVTLLMLKRSGSLARARVLAGKPRSALGSKPLFLHAV